MNVCLKTYAKQGEPERVVITLQERLPEHIIGPCELTCTFHVVSYGDYYLLTLDVVGTLAVNCQRCLHAFQYDYRNQSKLAVCATDIVAESLMEHFECIVAEACNSEISQYIENIGRNDEIIPPTLGL